VEEEEEGVQDESDEVGAAQEGGVARREGFGGFLGGMSVVVDGCRVWEEGGFPPYLDYLLTWAMRFGCG
jgi:hypothetical protein